ncbi:MAG: response regulator [Planctomycetota bacterium]
MSEFAPQLLLIVDDDEVLRSMLSRAFETRGFTTVTADSHEQAVEVARARSPDLAVVDLKMPGESGMAVLRDLQKISPKTKAVVLTGYGSITNAVEAMRLGAINYVTKPADADQILTAFQDERAADVSLQRPSLAESEWNHIQEVLADCDGNITQAARILDIPRRTLQRKLKKRSP